MLKGLALTPPVLGRISIGRVVEKAGKRLPEKDDGFTLTSQVQHRGSWVNHPLDEVLRKAPGAKLRSIAVRLLFDDPDLNLRASYSLFDRHTGRPLCVGNGQTCRRSTANGIQVLECASPEGCALGIEQGCKPYARLHVRIDVPGQGSVPTAAQIDAQTDSHADELGSFVFRTTGFNSIRTLSARLHYLHAVSGGRLSTLALELKLRGKSTTLSRRSPIYYVDLTVRSGLTVTQAVSQARAQWEARQAAGFDQAALDAAAKAGLALGVFEESAEEGAAVVAEFFAPNAEGLGSEGQTGIEHEGDLEVDRDVGGEAPTPHAPSPAAGVATVSNQALHGKLERKAARLLS